MRTRSVRAPTSRSFPPDDHLSDDHKPAVLVVDDTPMNLQVATDVLRGEYQALAATDGPKALTALERRPDVALILLDIMMPDMDGYEVCRRVKENPATAHIPVIFLTALSSTEDEQKAFEAGGVDFISKPFQPDTLMARVGTHVRLAMHERSLDGLIREQVAELERRTTELTSTRFQIISQLGRALEYKEDPSGTHVLRVSHYARLLAQAIGLSEDDVQRVYEAAPLHDLGKAGLPDALLADGAQLTPEQEQQLQQHPLIGAELVGEPASDLVESARRIVLTHHEHFDGSGYPQGLAGEDIPLEGRIVAIADSFDRIATASSLDQAMAALQAGAGSQFDPELVAAFAEHLTDIVDIAQRFGPDADANALAAESAGLAAMQALRAR